VNQGFFPTLGDLVARFRWLVVAAWIIFAGVSVIGARQVKGELVSGGISAPGSESNRGEQILADEFDRRPTRTAAVIFNSKRFVVTDQQYQDGVKQVVDAIAAVEGVGRVRSFYTTGLQRLVSEDKHTTYAVIELNGTEEEAKARVPDIRKAVEDHMSPDLDEAHVMGFPAVAFDTSDGSAEDLHHAELYSMPLTILLLLLVFGTVVAAGLPVMLGAAAVLTALGALFLIAQRMETSIFAMNTASMIGLGLGIDFSLLMVSRYREELGRGRTPHDATVRTVATAGQSIVFSGLTVMAGLSVMLLYNLTLVRSIALGMLLVAGLAVLGAVTLLPALMCLFGRNVNAFNLIPGRQVGGQKRTGTGRWHAWSLLMMRYPWIFMILSLAILLAMAWPAREMNAIGAGGSRGVSKEADSRKGFELLTTAFPTGEVAPMSILIRTNKTNGAFETPIREAVWQLTEDLKNDSRVARVESIANVNPSLTRDQFLAVTPEQLAGTDPRQRALVAQYLNIDRAKDTLHIVVTSKYGEIADETTDLIKDIRTNIVPGISQLKDADVLVTGQSALSLDYRDALFGEFPKLVGLVLLVTYVVLLLFFHSLLLPLKAILMNIVGIAASYGFLVMVFEWGILDSVLGFDHLGRLTMFPPVILFSILFGLSTDYEVFLLSRVKEIYRKQIGPDPEHPRVDPDLANEHSVAEGLEKTAGIITAAGLIMIVVFGAFAIGHVLVIKELGVGLAMAVLLDSTIIRVMLVPSSMKLMGHLNWWLPKSLAWIPEISEGAEDDEDEHEPAAGQRAYPRFCGRCGAALPTRARFCGRCGRVLAPPSEAGDRSPALAGVGAVGTHETIMTRGIPYEQAEAGRDGAPAGIMPPGASGLRRVPIVLRFGRVEQQAWLSLRDCQVEKDPSMPSVPIVEIEGIELRPMQGQEPPEIQIRNARIRY
jgi:RND superfamily putative drug exporter